jgi:hypothetical protein
MSAAAILSRLKQAGVSVAVADGQLKLNGPKAVLGDEVLNELRLAKPELLKLLSKPAVITEWRAAIEQVEPAAPEWQRLKSTSLSFLVSHDAVVATENGWDAMSLFGVHKGMAPKERVDCWGLVLFLAWGIHRRTVETIGEKACALRTKTGAVQSQRRLRANFDQAVPWWEHPAAAMQRNKASEC